MKKKKSLYKTETLVFVFSGLEKNSTIQKPIFLEVVPMFSIQTFAVHYIFL
jgi:hypothetical protein